jgi:NAD-dependent dihydropyrimidine dehydrogenase PreA subunit
VKGIVIYFSQSGNTKKIAKAIQAGMNEAGSFQCDIARLKEINSQEDLKKYDLIGLGSPVLASQEPPILTAFVSSMRFMDSKHTFVFCTHGALPGKFMARMIPALMQKGLTVIGWNDWFGSAWYPLVPKPYFTDGHPDKHDLTEAFEFGKEMVYRSKRIYADEGNLIPVFPQGKEYEKIYEPVMPPLAEVKHFQKLKARIQFFVNEDKCKYPKCRHCIEKCPAGSIDLSSSPPIFDRNCFMCFLCEQTCPQGAIEIDWGPLEKAHDPLVPPLQKALELFESRGRFRRLVPLEDIGWNTPVWKMKKPRFKVDE